MHPMFESLETRSLFSVAPIVAGHPVEPALAISISPLVASPVSATLAVKKITSAVSSKKFTVTYHSKNKINGTTIHKGNVVVTGPHGYTYTARLVSVSPTGNAKTIVATYKIAPTAGSTFTSSANGTYKVILAAKSVKDMKRKTNNAAVTLGTFKVNIPSLVPSLVGTYNGTTVVPGVSPQRSVQLTIATEDANGNFSGSWITDAGVTFNFNGTVAADGTFTYSFATAPNSGHATGPVTGSGTGKGGGTSTLAFSYTATSAGLSAPGTMNVTKV